MNYVQKYFEEIFKDFIEDSISKGIISHAEDFLAHIDNVEDISNYYVMSDAVYARMFEKVYESITSVYESAKVGYAEGFDLDDIGKTRGISRPLATHAYVEVTFFIENTVFEEDIHIPEGFIVSTSDNIEYVTLEEIYIPAGSHESTVQCQSVKTGSNQKIVAGSIDAIVSSNEYNLKCINNENSSGGSDEYTDDEYRYFLINWFKIHLKGSKEAFEYYFANLDGIDGYKLVPNFDVTGHSKIIVDPGTSYQLNQIYNELNGRVTQMNEDLLLCAPDKIKVNVYATINVDIDQINPYSLTEKEDIKSRIVQAIKVFIDGGYTTDNKYYSGLLIGEDFIPHKLAVFLDDEIPELKSINFTYPTTVQTIKDDEIGKCNDILIEVV